MLKLENRVKKGFIALTTAIILSPMADMFIPVHFQSPTGLYAQSQEKEKKQESTFFDEYSKKKEKKTIAQKPKYVLEPVSFDILDNKGNVYHSYRNITFNQAQNMVVDIPYKGKIHLENPQTIDDYITDIILYDKGKFKVALNENGVITSAFQDELDFARFDDSSLRTDLQEGGLSINFEKEGENLSEEEKNITSSLRFKYRFVNVPQEPFKEPCTPQPQQIPQPLSEPVPEPAQQSQPAPVKAPVKNVFELKALAILGGESYILTNNDPQKTFGGFMAEVVFNSRNIQAWANYLNLGYDVEDINLGGTVLKRHFSQANIGLDYAIGFLNFEIEAISSNNKYNSDRAHIFIIPVQETSYSGVFFSIGPVIFFSKNGFAGGSFITANYGAGWGNKKEQYADNLWRDLTYASESIKEKNYFKLYAKVPFGEVNYSQSEYDNALKTLKGERENLSIKGFLPLGKVFKPLGGFFLTGFYSISKMNDTQLKDFKNTMCGIGLTIRK